ncbi:MAG: DUF4402 domain-containing protein [Pseudoalteromonas sp.]
MRFCTILSLYLALCPLLVKSASIEQQALDFGTLVVLQSEQFGSVIIKDDGTINTTGDIYIIREGHPAELILTGIPTGTRVTMNLVAPVTLQHDTQGSSSADFKVSLNGFPKYGFGDEFGEVRVLIGGKLEINTSTKQFSDGNYSSSTNLEISVDY